MRKNIKVKRGLDLTLNGFIANPHRKSPEVITDTVAIVPDDFPGFQPRPAVSEGTRVSPGSVLFTDKVSPGVTIVSPVEGTVTAIVRGARRKILRMEIAPEKGGSTAVIAPSEGSTEERLKASGLWAMMRRRPYNIVPPEDERPRDIFVQADDNAPLAVGLPSLLTPEHNVLEAGVKALKTLTDGEVYVIARPGAISDIEGAVMLDMDGPYPSLLPGTAINAVAPINKGEAVWTLDLATLIRIGCMETGRQIEWLSPVAITGPGVNEPCIVRTVPGACVAQLLKGNLNASDGLHKRVISGNVLTGVNVGMGEDSYLRFPYRQVTVINEGDDINEFMGWASLSPRKMSMSPSFPSRLMNRLFSPDARLSGGRRAMIMSEIYDRVLPLDIMPEHLIKAILSRDLEKMEALGIYEVIPEDFSLAEYADPSKLELQKIVGEGLEWMRRELA